MTKKARLMKLDVLTEVLTVDAYGDEEQVSGFSSVPKKPSTRGTQIRHACYCDAGGQGQARSAPKEAAVAVGWHRASAQLLAPTATSWVNFVTPRTTRRRTSPIKTEAQHQPFSSSRS
jgi:hypothetical protein